MSLINSMLRDLEARRSDGTAAAPFQGQVRAVPARPAPTMKFKLGAVAGGVVLLAIAAVAGQRLWQAPAPAPVQQAAATVSAVGSPAAVPASVAPAVAAPTAAAQKETATGTPAPAGSEAVTKSADATETSGTAMPAAAKTPAPAKLATSVAPAASAATTVPPAPTASVVSAPSVASTTPAEPAKPTEQTEHTALTPRKAGEGSQPVTAPARRLPMQTGAMPQPPARAEATPLQPVAASVPALATPAAQPLKIVPEHAPPALPQPDMAMQLARQQLQGNALREAIDTLQRALPQAGSRADYHAFLAALLQRDDQHRAAAEHYATALRGAPDNGIWWMGLGISYQALQMAPQAQQAYRSAQASRALSAELAAFVEARLDQLQRP